MVRAAGGHPYPVRADARGNLSVHGPCASGFGLVDRTRVRFGSIRSMGATLRSLGGRGGPPVGRSRGHGPGPSLQAAARVLGGRLDPESRPRGTTFTLTIGSPSGHRRMRASPRVEIDYPSRAARGIHAVFSWRSISRVRKSLVMSPNCSAQFRSSIRRRRMSALVGRQVRRHVSRADGRAGALRKTGDFHKLRGRRGRPSSARIRSAASSTISSSSSH